MGPDGYEEFDGQCPGFLIPRGNGISVPPKWVKRGERGEVFGYISGQNKHDSPYVAELFASPSFRTNGKLDHQPAQIPGWFRRLMLGSGDGYRNLVHEAMGLEDWGVAADIQRFRRLQEDTEAYRAQIESLQADARLAKIKQEQVLERLRQARAPYFLGALEPTQRYGRATVAERSSGRKKSSSSESRKSSSGGWGEPPAEWHAT